MKIAFDAKRAFHNNTGLGNYSRSVIRAVADIRDQDQIYLITPKLNSIHSTQLLSNEISIMGTLGTNVIHCPSSNMKLACGFCDVINLSRQGVNIALGTDGAARGVFP